MLHRIGWRCKMAERRMFAKTIIDSDAFLDMPLSTQALYFHLSMRADDDGFINNPKKIARMLGVSDDDIRLLLAKKFVISFESGVVVIKHWRIHNYIQKDRYKPTNYHDEMAQLSVTENNGYTMDTPCIQVGDTGKVRKEIGKVRKEEDKSITPLNGFDNLPIDPKYIQDFIDNRKKLKKPMTDKAIELFVNSVIKHHNDGYDVVLLIEKAIMNGWQSLYPKPEDKIVNAGSAFGDKVGQNMHVFENFMKRREGEQNA